MSGRNNGANNNDREHRARERERRAADAVNMNVREQVQQQAQQRQQMARAGQNAGEHRGAIEPYALNSPRTMSSSSGHSLKRKIPSTFGPENVETWASTEVEQETFAFLWTLKGYTALAAGNEEIKSPTFRGGPKSLHSWQLKMNPKKKMDEQEFFAVHLILNGFGDSETPGGGNTRRLKVRFQISLLDSEGRPGKQAGSAIMTVCEFKRYSVWGYDKFLASSDLVSPTRRLVDEDTLKIHCRIWIEGELKHKLGQGGAIPEKLTDEEIKKQRLESLQDNFREVLSDNSFADVSLITESKTFMAHKVILAARSSVFKAMFNSNMVEAANNSVEINDFDAGVVKAMLEYMYTGETPSLNEKATDLLQIAEKYDLVRLKQDCEIAISANLTVENCAEILVLAHLHNANSLKTKVIDFINRNKDDVRKTPTFERVTLSHPLVFVDLYLSQ